MDAPHATVDEPYAGLPERYQPTNLPRCLRCGSQVAPGSTHVCPAPTITTVAGTYALTPWGTWEWRPW